MGEASEGEQARKLIRREYIFALRETLPLDESGWRVLFHDTSCPLFGGGMAPTVGCLCTPTFVEFVQVEAFDEGLSTATRRLSDLAGLLTGRSAQEEVPPEPEGIKSLASLARVSGPVADVGGENWVQEHFQGCFDALLTSVDGLRIATNARMPSLTIEQVWPHYLVLHYYDDSSAEVHNLVIVEHGRFFSQPPPADDRHLQMAGAFIDAMRGREPIMTYREYALSARTAAHTRGDYAEAALKAAVAAEVLLKNAASILIWEELNFGAEPGPIWMKHQQDVLGLKPSVIIGSILVPALNGNWDSSKDHSPVGAWRHHIARLRNSVIHHGHRPTGAEADQAVSALKALEAHVCDRLAARAQQYPRSALLSLGSHKLEERGAIGKVRATFTQPGSEDWGNQYIAWRDALSLDDSDDS